MRYYFVLSILILLQISCKKEIRKAEEFKEDVKTPASNQKPNCTGNNWQWSDAFFPGHCVDAFNHIPPLVYNNKAYTFHPGNQGQVTVRIYDGTGWTSVMSTIPDSHPLCYAYFGFVIGNKGYLAGFAATFEYSFETNTWLTKVAFPGSYRTHAATFVIGSKGYIVGGSSLTSNTINYYDTWEFDPALNQWQEKSSLPRGAARTATGFALINKGYIVNGYYKNGNTTIYHDDVFEYDPIADEWNYKSVFPGGGRRNTCVFVIGTAVYAGSGNGPGAPNPYGNFSDFYKYFPGSNTWEQVANLYPFDVKDPGKYGFAINNKGYVVFDSHTSGPEYYTLKYTPKTCIVPIQ